MTDGEKMLYAAVFAQCYDISNPPVIHDGDAWREWESARVHVAAECAAGAVERLREDLAGLGEGFGKDSNVYRFAKAMTSGRARPVRR